MMRTLCGLREACELGEKKGFSGNRSRSAHVMHQPFPTFPLVGTASLDELTSCLGALGIRLTDEELRWLNLEQ